jgi:hypothetical protein
MSLEKYKVNDGNHLPSIGDGRFKVYSKQFNELVDFIDTIDGGGTPGTGLYDIINEYTTGVGCTIDGVLLQDTNVDLNSDALATGKLIFDVDGDTYMSTSADDVLQFYVGGVNTMTSTSNIISFSAGVNHNFLGTVAFNGGVGYGGGTGSSGVISPDYGAFKITTLITGAAFTLGATTDGRVLKLLYTEEAAAGDTAIVTPSALVGGTTVTFNDLGDYAELMWDDDLASWIVTSLYNAVVA